MTEARFRIGDEYFPVPTRFRLVDPILVEEIAGVGFEEFAARANLAVGETAKTDMRVFVGLVAVAVWQTHPDWTRDHVVRFVSQIDFGSLTTEGGTEEVEDDPPAMGAAGNGSSSPTSSEESTTTAAAPA